MTNKLSLLLGTHPSTVYVSISMPNAKFSNWTSIVHTAQRKFVYNDRPRDDTVKRFCNVRGEARPPPQCSAL